MSLFRQEGPSCAPLADRLRPRSFEEFCGQEHLVGPDAPLRRAAAAGNPPSMILWGPPGSGKTTLVRLLASEADLRFVAFSAVLSGVKEVREIIAEARHQQETFGRRTLLFVDEIHRFNKAQQDAFLPHVEAGTVVLAGATTQNPSFEVNAALLSRCVVFALEPLDPAAVRLVLDRALDAERGFGGGGATVEESALELICEWSDGDARRALNLLELTVAAAGDDPVTPGMVLEAARSRALRYDRKGEEHYNVISAFHKSVRSSDPDAALYWLARMLVAGEDPLYVARRMIRMASEDIGNADPRALEITMAARETYHLLGSPEGELALAQAAAYLATAPKSNAVYKAWTRASETVEKHRADDVPLHLRNAPTGLMKEMGYGAGYLYDHDWEEAISPQSCLPERLADQVFYEPVSRGEEAAIAERLKRWRQRKEELRRGEEKGNA